ncbi:potassium/sodium uptake protein NtpJ [Enterococcus sp. DIV0176]|uniref:TrkH family potassium uptake protein n=1 Tax=Enterococcus sp. DIV0176 TaxID=2774758 RepID=UPI003D2F9FAF
MKTRLIQLFQKLSAVQLLAFGFFALIFTGGSLLSLPLFSRSGEATNYLDALFTATSAICVTGLTTLNTVEHWNGLGQLVLLILIEIGGLGFMMVPILYFTLARKKISLSTRIVLKEALNLEKMAGVTDLMLYIFKFALVIQLVGAVALSIVFVPEFGWIKGSWYGIFHAISSFCNAGFDLLGESLVAHQENNYLLLVISILIIAGGLGFIVWRDLLTFHQTKKISLHSKIALSMTSILLVGSFFVFLFTEKNGANFLQGNFSNRIVNTFFLSVTPRTAGYSSIDYSKMSHAGLILTMFLMYIGGTSGSTAGGLKTTTLGVLLAQMRSMFKGRTRAEIFGRTIRQPTILRALTLFFLTLTLCVVAVMILSITEYVPEKMGLEYIAFEVFSAFGTVGLTMGLTPDLSVVGKILIMALMYTGRVGVLTIAFSLMKKVHQQEIKIKYPEESVMIG